jgi:hypothetical protein
MARTTPDETFAEARAAMERGDWDGVFACLDGGGSVSSRLFVGETVENVQIDGTKSWGIRRGPDGFQEDVGFVRKKGVWLIRLFGSRPK